MFQTFHLIAENCQKIQKKKKKNPKKIIKKAEKGRFYESNKKQKIVNPKTFSHLVTTSFIRQLKFLQT